jgi:predicted RNase H-like HicB family nuclease
MLRSFRKSLKEQHLAPFMAMFTAIIQKEEDMFVARCPEVGTTSQGTTVEEALEHLREATEAYLSEFPIKESARPILATFEVATVAKP